MKPLPAIAIPATQRWREFRTRGVPTLVFAIVLVTVSYIWRAHSIAPTVIGEVQAIRADVMSMDDGVLTELNVALFQAVAANELVGELATTDPETFKASLTVIEADLN